jgi:polyphosphate kinase
MLKDERLAWDMQSDGSYKQRKPKNHEETSTHEILMLEAQKSIHSKV